MLDPGAGLGARMRRFVSRALAERPELSIEVVALDRVHVLIPAPRCSPTLASSRENVIFAGTRGAAPGVVELSGQP